MPGQPLVIEMLGWRQLDWQFSGYFERKNVLGVMGDAWRVTVTPFGKNLEAVGLLPILE